MKNSVEIFQKTLEHPARRIAKNFDSWKVSRVASYDRESLIDFFGANDLVMFFEHDPATNEMNFSDNFYTNTGYELGSITNLSHFFQVLNSEFLGLNFQGLTDAEYYEFVENKVQFLRYEHQITKKDGSLLWTSAYCRKVWLPDTESYLFVGIFTDVTELKMAQIELMEKASIFDMAFSEDIGVLFKYDPSNNKIDFSNSFFRILGYDESSLTSVEEFSKIVDGRDFETIQETISSYITNDSDDFNFEICLYKNDGSRICFDTRVRKVWFPGVNYPIIAGLAIDSTERIETKKKLHQLAYYDSTTGIPNRTYFNEKLDSTTKENTKGYLLFLDLDDFKKINDVYGHDFGDKILKEFSNRIKLSLPRDSFLGRLGGDEFAALVFTESLDEINKITDELLAAVRLPYEIDLKTIFTTSSLGIVDLNLESNDNTTLLMLADIAMYEAKNKGKNQKEFYNYEALLKIRRNSEIEEELRTAIENDELFCVYQPIFNAKTSEIYSFESLLRFNNKKIGLVSPSEFIPVAEKTGQILEIGPYGIIESARKAFEWLNKGYKFEKLNINVSYVGLQSDNLELGLKKISEEIGLRPDFINIELTETGLFEFQDEVAERMNSSICNGVNFSLDDFGTGFSSFRYLNETFFSSLKIDMMYIQRITNSEHDRNLVRNLIHLAHMLNMKVVAEGVETKEQLDMLVEMDVDYVQGFYLSKPLTAEEAEVLLKSRM